MERTHSWGLSAPVHEPVPALAAYDAGIAAICQLASQFDDFSWGAQTPCPEWRAFELAGHLRCVADDFHEYLDEAPVSRYARLMATGAHPDTLGRKLARQNAAELAALADAPPADHIAAFALSARTVCRQARRGVGPAPSSVPRHGGDRRRDGRRGVRRVAPACLGPGQGTGLNYRPADPAAVLAGWLAGVPHLPLPAGFTGSQGHAPSRSLACCAGSLRPAHGRPRGRYLRSTWTAWPVRLRRKRMAVRRRRE